MRFLNFITLSLFLMLLTGCVTDGVLPPDGNTNVNVNGNVNDNDSGNVNVNVNVNENVNENDNGNVNENDNDNGEVILMELDPITFFGDNLAGLDPASFEVAGGSVDFSGGVARQAVGVESPLTFGFVESWAWFTSVGPSTATIEFTNLDVRSFDVYFPDLGAPGGTLTALATDGSTVATIQSETSAFKGDMGPFRTINGSGQSIARLVISGTTSATVTVDQLTLTIAVPE